MPDTLPALKLAAFSSIIALCLWTAPARAQAGGMAGTTSNAGATSSGGSTTAGAGGTSGAGGVAGVANSSGGQSGGAGAGGMSSSAGAAGSSAAGGSAGMSSNLVTNGTFDTVKDPWWSNASSTSDPVAAMTMDVTNGQLCATITSGGKNPWDVIMGLSGVPLVKNQYYHIKFTMTADAPRRVKFKTGLGADPYSDYFIEPINITATAQTTEYTYLNLRDDPDAQFQFQIGTYGTSPSTGTVCVDDVVIEPVPAPLTPTYKTSAPSGHPFKDYNKIVKMGTAVDSPIFLSNALHNSIVAGEFSMISPANSMKMNLIQPKKGSSTSRIRTRCLPGPRRTASNSAVTLWFGTRRLPAG